jgi:hypothetical protein
MTGSEYDNDVVQITLGYIQEAKEARRSRLEKNKLNFQVYHLEQDFSHKIQGQSREFVGKQSAAVEQLSSFVMQALVDVGDWFSMEVQPGIEKPAIQADEAKKMLSNDLKHCDFITIVGDLMKLGLLQSIMIAKPHGEYKERGFFYSEAKEMPDGQFKDVLKRKSVSYWKPKIDTVRAEDFYPDPSGNGLYFGQDIEMDFHTVKAMSEGENAVYSRDMVDEIQAAYILSDMNEARKAQETGQNVSTSYNRRKVKITEFWGTLVNRDGEVIEENCMWTIADDRYLIQKPTGNPFWHNQIPYISAPLTRVPNSVWHKSPMDGATRLNIALNELFNLMLDDGMNSVHGLKQVRTDYLEDETQISNGIRAGLALKVNSQCPPGVKVVEPLIMGGMTSETLNVYNMTNSEFSLMALTNDLRMGVLPNRAVKATEVVEASQSITGVMTGITKTLESTVIEPMLYQIWANRLQHMDDAYYPELKSMVGQERADEIMAMSPAQRFAECIDGYQFKVFGISSILAKGKEFKKVVAALQTISADPSLNEAFQQEYSMQKLLGVFLKSLDLNVDQIRLNRDEKAQLDAQQQAAAQAMAAQSPDMQSQIPQATAQESAETVESMVPRSEMSGLQGKAQGGIN